MKLKRYEYITLSATLAACLLSVLFIDSSLAVIQGPCAGCHTMHNSQGGEPMAFNDSPLPNDNLLRGTCYGCHAQGGDTATVSIGTDMIPQVMHTDATDLAGGNFAYITGAKGSGNQDRGHNISDLTGADSALLYPPGLIGWAHDGLWFGKAGLTCAGDPGSNNLPTDTVGCHGYRLQDDSVLPNGVTGAHHNNADGKLDQATEPGNSYRFLMGVKGYESPDWEENPSSTDHNEYSGLTAPITLSGCWGSTSCHSSPAGIKTRDGTMSQFCATCHGNFHTLAFSGFAGTYEGVGPAASSPFVRHPTDLALPASGEYLNYTEYNLQAPVARTNGVPDSPGSTVTPGSDAVMCLSCHRSHASEFPDMLRWNYSTIITGEGVGNTDGCFVCHSSKN